VTQQGAARQSGRAALPSSRRIRMTRNAYSYASRVARCKREPWSSAAWKRARRLALWRQPRCRCGLPATDVHHKIPLVEGGSFLDQANLEPLCRRCHAIETGKLHERRQRQGWEPRPPRPGSRRVWPGALGDDPLGTGASDASPGRVF
jgi:5-methylcytosine-specific restriction endonuclease McrA